MYTTHSRGMSELNPFLPSFRRPPASAFMYDDVALRWSVGSFPQISSRPAHSTTAQQKNRQTVTDADVHGDRTETQSSERPGDRAHEPEHSESAGAPTPVTTHSRTATSASPPAHFSHAANAADEHVTAVNISPDSTIAQSLACRRSLSNRSPRLSSHTSPNLPSSMPRSMQERAQGCGRRAARCSSSRS